jgi:hypothetical protein
MPVFTVSVLSLLLALGLSAAEGVSLLPTDPTAAANAFGYGDHGKNSVKTAITVAGQPFDTAMRITLLGKPKQGFEVNRLFVVPTAVAKDEVLELSCWLRGTVAGSETPNLLIVHQLKDNPWTASINKKLTLSNEWTRYRMAWKVVADWKEGSHRVAFFLGTVADQQVEFGPIELLSHGMIDPASLGIPVIEAPSK